MIALSPDGSEIVATEVAPAPPRADDVVLIVPGGRRIVATEVVPVAEVGGPVAITIVVASTRAPALAALAHVIAPDRAAIATSTSCRGAADAVTELMRVPAPRHVLLLADDCAVAAPPGLDVHRIAPDDTAVGAVIGDTYEIHFPAAALGFDDRLQHVVVDGPGFRDADDVLHARPHGCFARPRMPDLGWEVPCVAAMFGRILFGLARSRSRRARRP